MNDQELTRALRAAVNVNHSTQFVARVCARVSQERVAAWPMRWLLTPVAAGIALAAALAIVAVGRADQHRAPTLPPLPEVPRPPLVTYVAPPNTVEVRHQPSEGHRRPAATRFPDVVISPDEKRAFALLVKSVREGRLPEEPPAHGVSTSRAVTLPLIEIPRVTIEPLPEIARLEGVRP